LAFRKTILGLLANCRILALIAAFCLNVPGCGESQPETYPVVVKVVYPGGEPVPNAQVVAVSDGSKISSRCSTGPDGTCRLTTYKPEDGAVRGRHLVIVAQPAVKGDPDVPYTGPHIADKFASVHSSGLVVDVSEDESKNQFTLTVTPR
jgi:hypothetical protein